MASKSLHPNMGPLIATLLCGYQKLRLHNTLNLDPDPD